MESKVYVNHGRAIVDCPYGCNNSYAVRPKMTHVVCKASDGCGIQFPLVIPENFDEIMAELQKRPDAKTRNWFPEDHPLAVRARLPMGQSVADLHAEFEMNAEE